MSRDIYTAEDSGGGIWYVASRPGYGRKQFKADVLTWIKDEDGDIAPHELTLYEWDGDEEAGRWLLGQPTAEGMKGRTWGQMSKQAHFADVEYVYPGDYVARDVK